VVAGVAACPGQLQFVPDGDKDTGNPASADGSAAPGPDAAEAATACPDIPTAVLAPQCGTTPGCHRSPTPAANLDLASPGVATRLVGVAATGSSGTLADPTHPDASILYKRVTAATSPMPPTGALDSATAACILSWIAGLQAGGTADAGAPPTDARADAPTGTVVRVACGTTAPFTDHNGNVWAADTSYTGGQVTMTSPPIPIGNTMDIQLYNAERYGADGAGPAPFTYTFTVANGSYAVNLKFAETYVKAAGQRQFNVSINGQQQLTNFDILQSAGGANTAVDKQFAVDVTAGQLTLQFNPGAVQSPKVDAIEILPK
jgi:hypothetical protein